jgi:hypothetical protein
MRQKLLVMSLTLSVGGLLLSGCASYPRNRAEDLADIFGAEASRGSGAHVNIQVTDFFGTGLGFSKQQGIALHGRYIGTSTRESGGFLIMNLSGVEKDNTRMRPLFTGGRDYADMQTEGIHIYDDTRGSMWCIVPMDLAWNGSSLYLDSMKERWWRIFDVSLGASALVGFNLCISPGETADFVLGWTGIDLAGDDFKNEKPSTEGDQSNEEKSNKANEPTSLNAGDSVDAQSEAALF